MTESKITLTVQADLAKKIEKAAEDKFQTVEQFILDCVSARLQGGTKALSVGGGLEDILTMSEFSEWLANQIHDPLCRELYPIFDTFTKSGGTEGMPVVKVAGRSR